MTGTIQKGRRMSLARRQLSGTVPRIKLFRGMDDPPTSIDVAPSLAPLRFEPILKRLIWGGRRLGSVLNKPIGPEADYAESWELSDHRNGQSEVAEGPLHGTSLQELVHSRGGELLGSTLQHHQQFPILIKFIDAARVLSVQVHPDDEIGHQLANDNGKNESWVVLDAEPGSLLYAGLKSGVSRTDFVEAVRTGRIEELLHRFEPRPGDCIHIPAGTVHAIGAGVLLVEVQQMSDATFRVFDWDRVDAEGKPRKLHVTEALEAIDFERGPVNPITPQREVIEGGILESLVHCEFFELDRLRLTGESLVGVDDGSRFTALVALEGLSEIEFDSNRYPLSPNQTMLLPASAGACPIRVLDGEAIILSCTVPGVKD